MFLGQILAAPLYGSISVMGAIISSGREIPTELNGDEDLPTHFYPVFSTRTHSLLRISSTPLDNTPSLRQPHNEPEHIDFSLIEAVHDELKQEINEFESIVVIKDNSSSGLQSMNIQFPAYKNMFKFRKVETEQKRLNKHMAINMIRGFSPLLFEPVAGVRPFHIESSWQSRADYALKNASNDQAFTSVVCGAKDTGKSTFTKYYVNRLLSVYDCVAYIETDLGQPEFSPSGMLSLHYITQPILGPAFSHQHLEPARSFFFGSVHPKDNPDYYLACFSELVDHWQTTKHIPLVVNTQGWVSGLGYDLLMDQIQKVSPTDIFATRHAMLRYRNLPATFNADVINMIGNDAATTHSIDCVIQQTTESTLSGNYTAADHREMTLGSYFFNKRARNTDVYPKWDYHTHMMDRIPWSIDWRVGLNSIWVIYEEVKLDQLFYALNGTMIALVGDVSNFEKQKGPNNEIGENNKFVSSGNIVFLAQMKKTWHG